jgi:hypothetical protein
MKSVRTTIGAALAVVGFLVLLLPGPLGWPGIPPLLFGLLLIMSGSVGARRWFIQASRQDKLMFGRFRTWLRGRAKKRHERRLTGKASDAPKRS